MPRQLLPGIVWHKAKNERFGGDKKKTIANTSPIAPQKWFREQAFVLWERQAGLGWNSCTILTQAILTQGILRTLKLF